MIIDYVPDVVDFGGCLMQNLMHVDHCHAIEVLVRVVAPEILMLHLILVKHVDSIDGLRLMDFDFVLQMYLNIIQNKISNSTNKIGKNNIFCCCCCFLMILKVIKNVFILQMN